MFLGEARIPVPNDGACDWGLDNAGIRAGCKTCEQYYDARSHYGNTDDGACIYVSSRDKCFPTAWAREETYNTDLCGECQNHYHYLGNDAMKKK